MNETELYARIGRLMLALEQQKDEYAKLLRVLGCVVVGDIARSRVLVNFTAQTWLVSEPASSPAVPGTVNGLPEVVVGKVEEPVNRVAEALANANGEAPPG